MKIKLSQRCFSNAKTIFFDVISTKFRPGIFKGSLNLVYIIFEKVAINFRIFLDSYIEMYDEIVNKEIKLANISKKDKILVIGAGSIPATSVQIAKTINANVVSIDIDKSAIINAKKLVEHLGLSDKLIMETADGSNYFFEKFDVIFILYGITKNIELFNNLSKRIRTGTRIIFRSVFDKEKNTIKSNVDLSELFVIKNITKSVKIPPVASVLLLKKEN
jgi:protein-L-isoaspartate O-methyltransferase